MTNNIQSTLSAAARAEEAAKQLTRRLLLDLENRFGIRMRMGGEIEFFPLNKDGKPQPNLVELDRLNGLLHPQYFERAYYDGLTKRQLEVVTRPLDPLTMAESLAAFKIGVQAHAKQWGLGGASFRAAHKGEFIENSGMHINQSLVDTNGHNIFVGKMRGLSHLLYHVRDATLATQKDGVLAYAPNDSSYDRYNSHRGFTGKKLFKIRRLADILLYFSSSSPTTIYHMKNKTPRLGGNIIETAYRFIQMSLKLYSGFGAGIGVSLAVRADGSNTRIENRLPGADANPYVAVAMDVAITHDSICRNLRDYTHGSPIDPVQEELIQIGSRELDGKNWTVFG